MHSAITMKQQKRNKLNLFNNLQWLNKDLFIMNKSLFLFTNTYYWLNVFSSYAKQNNTSTVTKNTFQKYNIKLSKTSYTYDGKTKKPSVTVKDSKGNKINKKYYTISYSKGKKNVGKYTVTIKFKGKHSGKYTKTFTIKPKGTSISKLTAKEAGFTVKWKKQATQTTGYQIQYSTSSKFKDAKTVTISKNKTTSKSIYKSEKRSIGKLASFFFIR